MTIYPHDHQLWAVIGLYGGQEDNTFYRRNRDGQGLERAGFRELQSQDAINLGRDAIHAVHNPRQMYTGAIHIYGGDFFAKPRSEWADESSPEMPYSVEGAMRAFAESLNVAPVILSAAKNPIPSAETLRSAGAVR